METILIIEDEVDIAELIGFNLERHEFSVLMAHDGVSGLEQAYHTKPDLIVLDVMLPKKSGYAVFKELRNDKRTKGIPVILLTAKSQTEDRIFGLEQGVDDYLTKPFSPKELMLRIKSILRRSKIQMQAKTNHFKCPPFAFHSGTLDFYVGDELVDLTSTEFKLMLYLCQHANQAQSRQTLLTEVWGYHEDVNSRTLDTHMKRLRQKLGTEAEKLETVRGVGYKIISNTKDTSL